MPIRACIFNTAIKIKPFTSQHSHIAPQMRCTSRAPATSSRPSHNVDALRHPATSSRHGGSGRARGRAPSPPAGPARTEFRPLACHSHGLHVATPRRVAFIRWIPPECAQARAPSHIAIAVQSFLSGRCTKYTSSASPSASTSYYRNIDKNPLY
jgi:hypothetical protein